MNNYSYATRPATISAVAGAVLFGAVGMTNISSPEFSSEKIHAIYSAAANSAHPEFNVVGSVGPTWRVNTGAAVAPLSADAILLQASAAFTAALIDGMESLGNQFATVLEDNFWDLVL
ncbi:hypothetical protein QLG14_20535 [Pseudomonas sp. V104_10]|uniref:hypothetical protein n=1 Tax=Pseudomonas sp. V104_10 TaxID=3044231 RepID=UPI00249F7066|nr:hypothetical protein [Pseudomonas sp. V104_10]MDI3371628.1 hypothetical protein [Pseudomonas sp. V104_10]